MENKQTAVEWIESQLDWLNRDMSEQDRVWLFNRAKAMEKEQMGKFYNEGKDFAQYTHDEQYGGIEYWDREPLGFEEYYNETYGK